MTDIIVVVDAQNGFCHPEGAAIKNKKTREEEMALGRIVVRIRNFLNEARAQGLPCTFLCANFRLLYTNLRWDTQIHDELSPQKKELTFWRDNPDDDPFLFGLDDFLKKFSNPNIILCGFLSDCCVEHTALMALKRKISVSFLLDCTYPPYHKKRKSFLSAAQKKPWSVDVSLIRFATSQNILYKTTPVPD